MDVWIQLALSLSLTAAPSVAATPSPARVAKVVQAAAAWHHPAPPPSSPSAVGQLRFGRRLAGPRVERGATAPVTRALAAPRESWTTLLDRVETRPLSCRLAAPLERGPPIAG